MELVEDAAAGEPVAGLTEVVGCGVVAVLPDAALIEDLDEDVGADGEGDAGVEEVARIDDDGSAAAFGSEGAESVEEIFDGAVAFEQVHVFDAAEVAVECGGEDDDGDVGTAAAEKRGDLGAELTCAEVIVEDGDVDVVEEVGGFFDGGGGDALVAMLSQDGGAEMQIARFVVEQKDAHGLEVRVGHSVMRARNGIRRLYHGLPPYFDATYTTIVTSERLF
jgi:hypothetical protein